jgi:hypothetical protein
MNRWVAIVVFLSALLSGTSVAQEIRRPTAESGPISGCLAGALPNFWDGGGISTSSTQTVSSHTQTSYCMGTVLSAWQPPSAPYTSLALTIVWTGDATIYYSTNNGATYQVADAYYYYSDNHSQHTKIIALSPGQDLSLLRVEWTIGAAGNCWYDPDVHRTVCDASASSITGYDVRTEGVLAPIAPAAPTNLATTPAANGLSVNLTWTDNATDETSYKVQRCTGASCTPADLITGLAANVASYNDTTTAAGTTYWYNVCAVNGVGASCAATPVTVTTPSLPAQPTITSLSQQTGALGTPLTITGANFGDTQGTSTVTFQGSGTRVSATPTAWSNANITVTVPNGAVTGPVIVTVGTQSSNSVSFTVSGSPDPPIPTVPPDGCIVGSARDSGTDVRLVFARITATLPSVELLVL